MCNCFIAFLGNNQYVGCNYYLEDDKSKKVDNVKFIQEALVRIFCCDWSKDDKILIFTTNEAKKVNWSDPSGLKKRLLKLELKCSIENIEIPTASTETEMWDIYKILIDSIPDRSTIIFDITHSFRYQPVLATTALNYLKVIKDVRLKGIYYGAFEKLGNIEKVKKLDSKDRNAPILNLTPAHVIQDWARAVNIFAETGRSHLISKLGIENIKPILKEARGRDATLKKLDIVFKRIEKISKNIETCRIPEILDEDFDSLKDDLKSLKDQKYVIQFNPVLDNLLDIFSKFKSNDIMNGFECISLCIMYGLTQQGYTFLREMIITYILQKMGYRYDNPEEKLSYFLNRDVREYISKCISELATTITKESQIQPISEHVSTCSSELANEKNSNKIKEITEKFSKLKKSNKLYELAKIYKNKIITKRNDLNHGGFSHNNQRDIFKTLVCDYGETINTIKLL